MQKNTKRLLAAALAAAVLGGAYAALLRSPNPKDEQDYETVSLTEIASGSLKSVQCSLRDGENYTLSFATDDSGTTYTMSGEDADYSSSLMQELMDAAGSVSGRVVETDCTDLSNYGLSDSDETDTIVITDTDDKTTTLRIGLSNDFGTYCTADDSTIVLLSEDTAQSLTHPQSYYRNLTILGSYYSLSSELETLTISSLSDGTEFSIARRDTSDIPEDAQSAYSDFIITSPITWAADDTALSSGLLSDLQSAMTANSIVTDKAEDLSQYGLDDSAVHLHLTANNLDAVVLVGNTTDDGTYVKNQAQDTVYLCSADAFSFLDADWNDWRSTALFTCGLTELSSVTVTQGDTTQKITVTQTPADENEDADTAKTTAELEDGTELDASKLQQALTSVNFVRTLSQPEDAKTEVSVSIKLTDGSTHTLDFAKGGSREYLVSVDDSGYLYGVAQADLDSILSAISA